MSQTDRQRQTAAALGRIPSGLFVMTIRHGEAETGMLASWVQQCSFEPLQLSLAVKRGRAVLAWLGQGTTFTLNILDTAQTDMIGHFGRGFSLGEPAFTGLEIDRPDGVAPVLGESLAYLVCRVAGRFEAGDHDLLIADVVHGQVFGEGEPMVHIRKSALHY